MLKSCWLCFVCEPESSSSSCWKAAGVALWHFLIKKKKLSIEILWAIARNDLRDLTIGLIAKTNWASSHRLLNLLPSGLLLQLLLLLKLILTFHGCLLLGLLLGQTLQAEASVQAQNMLNQFEVNIQSMTECATHLIVFLIDLGHFLFNLLLLLLLPLLLLDLGFKHSSQPLIPLPATSQGVELRNKEQNLPTPIFIVSQGSLLTF